MNPKFEHDFDKMVEADIDYSKELKFSSAAKALKDHHPHHGHPFDSDIRWARGTNFTESRETINPTEIDNADES